MEIHATNRNTATGAVSYRGSASTAGQKGRAVSRFDSIMLQTQNRGVPVAQMELRSRISQEVRASTTPGRLSALRQQVESDTYPVDAVSIAKRMLMLPEEG